jgi:cytochrome oxidase Cu insertion factor (SCO1/SenC/PrrC family)
MKFHLSSRAALVIIAAMFILPLVLALLMWSGAIDFKPGSAHNLGELVQPPVPVDWEHRLAPVPSPGKAGESGSPLSFSGHWVILHAMPVDCPAACLEAVAGLRQVHKAAGRHQSRIRVALLLQDDRPGGTDGELNQVYPLFELVENPDGEIRPLLAEIAGRFSSTAGGSSYLIDPIGNIMMFYEAGSDPNHLKKDLKRLLTWSKLDK